MTDMTDSLVATIERSSERAWLTRCSEYNANLGKKIVVDAVARRLRDLDLHDALRARPEAHSVEERVGESLRVYRELLKHKHGRNQAAGVNTRPKVTPLSRPIVTPLRSSESSSTTLVVVVVVPVGMWAKAKPVGVSRSSTYPRALYFVYL